MFGNNYVYNKKYRYNILLQENNYTDNGISIRDTTIKTDDYNRENLF